MPEISESAVLDDAPISVVQPSPVQQSSDDVAHVDDPAIIGGEVATTGERVVPIPTVRAVAAASKVHRASAPQLQPIVRPAGLPRATVPGNVPAPEHHHLPGWVRRSHGQARPILADLLGLLEGEPRQAFQASVDSFTARVSAGKFSVAWQYPGLIAEGMALYEAHRKDHVEQSIARRNLETMRRKVADQLRESTLGADAVARLHRTLRSAADAEAVRAVGAEVGQAAGVARTSQEKRRDREIERTRARIKAAGPRAADIPAESWQDVLRRFAESQE